MTFGQGQKQPRTLHSRTGTIESRSATSRSKNKRKRAREQDSSSATSWGQRQLAAASRRPLENISNTSTHTPYPSSGERGPLGGALLTTQAAYYFTPVCHPASLTAPSCCMWAHTGRCSGELPPSDAGACQELAPHHSDAPADATDGQTWGKALKLPLALAHVGQPVNQNNTSVPTAN